MTGPCPEEFTYADNLSPYRFFDFRGDAGGVVVHLFGGQGRETRNARGTGAPRRSSGGKPGGDGEPSGPQTSGHGTAEASRTVRPARAFGGHCPLLRSRGAEDDDAGP